MKEEIREFYIEKQKKQNIFLIIFRKNGQNLWKTCVWEEKNSNSEKTVVFCPVSIIL